MNSSIKLDRTQILLVIFFRLLDKSIFPVNCSLSSNIFISLLLILFSLSHCKFYLIFELNDISTGLDGLDDLITRSINLDEIIDTADISTLCELSVAFRSMNKPIKVISSHLLSGLKILNIFGAYES